MKCLLIGGPHNETVRKVDGDWIPHGMFLKAPDGTSVFYRARVLALRRMFSDLQVQLYTTEDVMEVLTPDIVDSLLRKHNLYPYERNEFKPKRRGHVYG